jgi:transketolase
MRMQFVKTVSDIFKKDNRVVLLLGDIGVFGFRDLLSDHSDRAYNIGILEQSTISMSSGLALAGLIPIVHTIAPFLVERSLEQIKVDLCYQELGANLVSIGGSYDYAALGCTHHCPADIPTLNEIPNIEIIIPGHPKEFDKLFRQCYDNSSPTYYKLSATNNTQDYDVDFGKNLIIQEKGDIVIIAVGEMLNTVLEATYDLDVTIIYCTTVKPFDVNSIQKFLNKKIVIVEPYYSGSVLTNIIRECNGFSGDVTNIGITNEFINKYGKKCEIDSMIGVDTHSVRKKIMERINEN